METPAITERSMFEERAVEIAADATAADFPKAFAITLKIKF
jgi:hypothetical protein